MMRFMTRKIAHFLSLMSFFFEKSTTPLLSNKSVWEKRCSKLMPAPFGPKHHPPFFLTYCSGFSSFWSDGIPPTTTNLPITKFPSMYKETSPRLLTLQNTKQARGLKPKKLSFYLNPNRVSHISSICWKIFS